MTLPRKSLVSLDDTPFYHCVSRCVRRAFLCGIDHYSAKNYEHRRDWLEMKLRHTADIFAIRLCAYAVMSNHYHVVLHIRADLAKSWSEHEVVERWHRLFHGTPLSQRFVLGKPLSEPQWHVLRKDIKRWRHRLMDLSWYMRIVNESIARQANAEDRCTGRFWEGRFKSQALLDDAALLSCMAYVDLNPIRAGMAHRPETSEYTSIKHRIKGFVDSDDPSPLEDFVGIKEDAIGVPFKLRDYLQLVDWTGRIIRYDKRGAIDSQAPPILERLGLQSSAWITLTTEFEKQFSHWVGAAEHVARVCQAKSYKRPPSTLAHRSLFQ